MKYFDTLSRAKLGIGSRGNDKKECYRYGEDFGRLDVTESNGNYILDNEHVRTIDMRHKSSGGTTHSFQALENLYQNINGLLTSKWCALFRQYYLWHG